MSHTAWARASRANNSGGSSRGHGHSSALTSDLLTPSRSTTNKSKSRDQSRTPNEPIKSKAVRRLENLLLAVESGSYAPKYPKEGCFCRARRHKLSRYIPLCTHCGLVLCELQHPALPCPACHSSLLTQSPTTRPALVTKITAERDGVLRSEAEVRERERAEEIERAIAQAGGGAFPVLGASSSSHQQPAVNQPHKVLSLNSKTKKVMVSTTVPRSSPSTPPGPSAAELAAEEAELEDCIPGPNTLEVRKTRVLAPKVLTQHGERVGNERRWEPVGGGGAMYVQPPGQKTEGGGGGRRKKGKKENVAASASGS